jgi:predicted nucleotidyltransferase
MTTDGADPVQQAAATAGELRDAFGDRLRSVVLYGSAARGEWIDGISDLNLLVLLDRIEPPTLRDAAPAALRWAEAGVAPLLLQAEDWRRAADAFAIEIQDMLAARHVLLGPDPLERTSVHPATERLQAERELRGKLVRLHTGMMLAADDPGSLGTLLVSAVPALTTYLRSALRLAGTTVPATSEEVIAAGARCVNGPPEGLTRALEARRRREPWRVAIDDPIVEACNRLAERTATYLDSPGGTRR